ncbi:unnamed protein product [Sphagnum troendelagicum]|uniref:GPI transamidase component PIG-T n=1 Tax=Sphagnum troendelagicum TaxID=128251 RepID=A0ABP0UD46_9BRYO
MGLPSRHNRCSSWSRSIHLLLLLLLCGALALSSSALEEVQGEQEEVATTTTRAETATVQGASASRAHHNYGVVVKKREEACVVGGGEGEGDGDAFRARYCVELYLKDVGARRNHLHSLRWLRLEHVNLLLPGDASGPIGTHMVLSFSSSSSNKHRSSHDGDGDDRHHHPLVSADLLSRIELLLKEIVGGAALGWEQHGPSVQQHQQQQQQRQQRQQQQEDVGALKEIREIKSPLKKMVIVKGEHEAEEVGGVVGDLSTVVLSSPLLFEDFLLNLTEKVMTSSTDTRTVGSVLGLWHWLPSRFVGNTAPKGSNGLPSFFLSLGSSTKAHPRSEKQGGPLLQSWLAGQAPLWAQELSSKWQVHQHSLTITLPEDRHKGLSLAFCESAYTSSPPKCVSMSHTTTVSSETSYDIPTEARLQVHHNSADLAHCRSSHLSEAANGDANGDVNGELWVLQDVERILVGNGAHRTLQSVVTVALHSGRTIESQQPHCYLRILERLPTGVFADQYELQGLRRRGVVKEAFVYGDKNLEQPALLSAQSIVDVHVTLLKEQSKQSSQVPLLLQAKVSVPLHARYPPLSVESHSVVRIPLPHIFVACKQAGVQDSSALDETVGDWRPVLLGAITTSTNSSKVVEWMVPAGKPAQFEVVARYTAIAALSGVLAVFVASVSKEHHY